MPTRNDQNRPPKKKPSKAGAGPTQPSGAASGDDPPPRDGAFFEKIKSRIASRPNADRNILLNIPVWGWTGDGKTCALLTMLHYAEAPRHAMSLAFVTDRDELAGVENEVDAYQGLNLGALAASTKARLSELSEAFIDNATWPPGTDEPSSYLFAVRAINSTLAYLVIPDLQGGSFREVDEVARTVLANAHACVILVQPEAYVDPGVDGKRYRDEVMSRITKCAEAKIPACLMITKSDLYAEPHSLADKTMSELTVLVRSHKDLEAEIFRVSVIGTAEVSTPSTGTDSSDVVLPKPGERHPEQLIRAFVWVLDRALARPVADVRAQVPELGLRRAREEAQPSREPIPELRKLGEFSDRPGLVVCGLAPDAFLFVTEDGSLVRASYRDGSFTTKAAGSIAGASAPTSEFVAFHLSGELVVAPSQATDAVWIGALGDQLTRTPLPSDVVSWAPVSSRGLVALDATGRLHSLRFDGTGWSQVEFIADFIPPTERLICSFTDRQREVLALNGAKAEAIHLQNQGKFGERRKPVLAATFDGARFELNRVGVFAGTNAAGDALCANGAKTHNLGQLRKETTASLAIPSEGRHVAILGADLKLSAATVNGDHLRRTEATYSPQLPKDPDSMVWSTDGQILVVTFPDGTYSAFKPVGLRAR